MLKQLEGSQGVAQAVALCRPEVVCAYPISPQTHIVEALGALCRHDLAHPVQRHIAAQHGAIDHKAGRAIDLHGGAKLRVKMT